jgi:50S ribosomal subunit-associated GTPase HflX
VVDASDESLERKRGAVDRLLEELKLASIPRLAVLNKCDRLPEGQVGHLARRYEGIPISATRREGLLELIAAAERVLQGSHPRLVEQLG